MLTKRSSILLLSLACVLVACGSNPVVVDQKKIPTVKEYNMITQGTGAVVDPMHGAEVRFAYGAIAGVNGVNANGVGFVHTFADGVSVITANLNILPAPAGKRFVVWMTDSAGANVVAGADMNSIIGDARHSSKFEMKEDPAVFTTILVTLESSAKPSSPGPHQAEGTMKEFKKQ